MALFKYVLDRLRTVIRVPFLYRNFLTAYADYFRLISDRAVVYELRNGMRFKARAGKFDIAMISEVIDEKIYERKAQDILIRPDDTIVDIGGFIGDFAVFAARKAPHGSVHSFEPSPGSYQLMEENIALNQLGNVVTHQKAVAGESGVLELLIPDFAEHSNTTDPALLGNGSFQKFTVDSVGINALLADLPHLPTFMKVDCEGAEFGIFDTIEDGYLANLRCLIIEYHLHDRQKDQRATVLKKRLEPYFHLHDKPLGTQQNLVLGMLYCRSKNLR
ncbi:FkbM family methyltransferase [Tellurirhabdus bombi]|uniref:FkbM family methyltransferase n=1 Tax=Tellurirhabdus bombi TaxID=2907205 RepID=UPI001F023C4A|nr:FkbM family methyltransferase [Tellurirhabdus bombi]